MALQKATALPRTTTTTLTLPAIMTATPPVSTSTRKPARSRSAPGRCWTRMELDGAGEGATNPYNVVVRAVDGDGDTQNIDVAIHVLMYHEPPVIDRVYQTGRPGVGHSVGDRVPTEISHWEKDRTPRSATRLDADLESGVLDYSGAMPALKTPSTFTIGGQALIASFRLPPTGQRTRTASPTLNGIWRGTTRACSDSRLPAVDTGPSATLMFGMPPDFEKRKDKNQDNVYEVTIVVTDGTARHVW